MPESQQDGDLASPDGPTNPEGPDFLRRPFAAIFVISAATLLLELTLTRVFDVILWSNLGYLIVSSAIFGFGVGAIALMGPLRQAPTGRILTSAATVFGVAVLTLIPAISGTRANLDEINSRSVGQFLSFALLYLFLLLPFAASGILVSTLVTRRSQQIHRLYFFDLLGAGVGCLGIFVLPSLIGAESTLLVVAAGGPACLLLVSPRKGLGAGSGWGWLAVLALLTFSVANRLEFPSLVEKHQGRMGDRSIAEVLEFSHWDPVSKIEVFGNAGNYWKRVAYDGGSQGTSLFSVTGPIDSLRPHYFDVVNHGTRYNYGKYAALAEWLKRDTHVRALVIGSAGGQETLAALTWGAEHVDAVEMVCTVTALTRGKYDGYLGHVFTDPRVTSVCDEGRSYLRHASRRYDVIQIHSNHTVSSVANGSGGAEPVYLQTVEAYEDYFSHLTDNGVLQINYFLYPRMVTTAAAAWDKLFPGDPFANHLVVTAGAHTMSTLLVKRSPWTPAEVDTIRYFLGPAIPDTKTYAIVYAPGTPEAARFPAEFLKVPLDPAFLKRLPYQVAPPTDDRPFFRDVRKVFRRLEADSAGYLPAETASYLNSSLRGIVPMESVHLYLLGGLSVLIAVIVLLVPMRWAPKSIRHGAATLPALGYFACLGIGFILVELIMLYKFMLVVGFPIYSMATVLFTLLVFAGIGSGLSERLVSRIGRRAIWILPIITAALAAFTVVFPLVRDLALGLSQGLRIAVSIAAVAPVAVLLGTAFPLGIDMVKERAPGLIAWGWGINAIMTVIGSLVAVILGLRFGFDATLMVAGGLYLLAGGCLLALPHGKGLEGAAP